jgi:DNA-binding transcriptional MerR regulator
MAERAHLSIGEVLSLLQQEFPDVTISKIRFLESQGLLDPERTPSGYRKFYPPDIDRLRWILRQQQDNYLPLKVIKGRLEEVEEGAPSDPRTMPTVDLDGGFEEADALDAGVSGASMNLDELAGAAGLNRDTVQDLERFGLIVGRSVGADTFYDEDALLVAQVAAGFVRHGIEPRHLRMYKVASDRESSFFEQLVTPMLKQRNPAARRQALDTVSELAGLGQNMRSALLRQSLRGYLGS